ncbi:MAG: hypothetical protein WC852_02500 [Candidatus Nanoarchaeia archaeon]|jgi:hypothetical protein
MSKLSIVRQTLEEKAIIVHVEEENIPLNLCMGWPHKVDFYIAPKEPLYKADELNAFMDSLIPDMEPSYKTYFKQEKEALITGALCFDEKIGELRTKYERFITITDMDMIKNCEWANGKFLIDSIEQRDYMRRISVRPYPNAEIIEEVLHHNLPRWKIEMELIMEYHDKRNFLLKLLSRLSHKH